ncbi:Phosphoribosylaminoimidazole-succinocarboxamide synthase [Thalassoglobus neptunius]|uniref:Phosphoribosylaminoimidazole-succinocarboxamide synthase n=1 Tax=Thalassoglobus neptunius TaxID=1938619 RepID=A0A5C5WGE3_9PLAN|nr:phosphoribosylaminoimidazolesuccinocarboxamide synthase [Thalassoglobus neptunius]TWT49866.1 Phosphoribosylaminoimidazole-succinocarboxamide synthase [Thalassoglobus neptunius]
MPHPPVVSTSIPEVPVQRGKVRDIYDFGDRLLLIATDRISAFDWILPTAIADKGRVLTQISAFWFSQITLPHHLLSLDPGELPIPDGVNLEELEGRSMVVRKTKVIPVECVVRGYLEGSGWKEYQKSQTVCGEPLPPGLLQGSQLPEPIFTPATKAEQGHDENISFQQMCNLLGTNLAEDLRKKSLEIYRTAVNRAEQCGLIIADTKFEFGLIGSEVILIDEVLTPDSSRFWAKDTYEPGHAQLSFDKQFVREWLESTDWDKNSPPPELPREIVTQTRSKYIDAYEQLTGQSFAWKEA